MEAIWTCVHYVKNLWLKKPLLLQSFSEIIEKTAKNGVVSVATMIRMLIEKFQNIKMLLVVCGCLMVSTNGWDKYFYRRKP